MFYGHFCRINPKNEVLSDQKNICLQYEVKVDLKNQNYDIVYKKRVGPGPRHPGRET